MVELVTNPNLRIFGEAVNIMNDVEQMSRDSDPAWLEITVAVAFLQVTSVNFAVLDELQCCTIGNHNAGAAPTPR